MHRPQLRGSKPYRRLCRLPLSELNRAKKSRSGYGRILRPLQAIILPSSPSVSLLPSPDSRLSGVVNTESAPSPISSRVPKVLHEVLLSGWGMPIGEMFDLEALSAECAKQGRYEFFLSSVPTKVPNGVAR